MIKKILKIAGMPNGEERKAALRSKLMRREAQIGGELFGPIPKGSRREFFCLDEYTWIWHEEWTDPGGKYRIRTTRYEVRTGGIVKAQDGQPYQLLSKQEATHLAEAVVAYEKRVRKELYQVSEVNA